MDTVLKTSRRHPVVVWGAVIVVAIGLEIWWGSRPDPRFSLQSLQGMTPDEVIAARGQPRFGDPRTDPRLPPQDRWTAAREAELGPLILDYQGRLNWMGFSYAVVFADNKVVEVKIGTK